jgi:hypothetical protein
MLLIVMFKTGLWRVKPELPVRRPGLPRGLADLDEADEGDAPPKDNVSPERIVTRLPWTQPSPHEPRQCRLTGFAPNAICAKCGVDKFTQRPVRGS